MEKSLKNKSVVVTGGAVGIGFEIAYNVILNGAELVVILDINEAAGKETVEKLNAKFGEKAFFMKCDITSEKDLNTIPEAIFKKYNKIDILVNNAGIFNETDWKKCVDINLTYSIGWTYKFWEHMRKDQGGNGGTILNVCSIWGKAIAPFSPTYHATKFGFIAFTRSLGSEYNFKKSGVRVIALCPGFTNTALTANFSLRYNDYFGSDFNDYTDKVLWQGPDAVGKAAVEIIETAASGEEWVVEGGQSIKRTTVLEDFLG